MEGAEGREDGWGLLADLLEAALHLCSDFGSSLFGRPSGGGLGLLLVRFGGPSGVDPEKCSVKSDLMVIQAAATASPPPRQATPNGVREAAGRAFAGAAVGDTRGNHLSNTTCPKHAFLKVAKNVVNRDDP